eukprot:4729864-Pleurochrysis_carterae.AAC.2
MSPMHTNAIQRTALAAQNSQGGLAGARWLPQEGRSECETYKYKLHTTQIMQMAATHVQHSLCRCSARADSS